MQTSFLRPKSLLPAHRTMTDEVERLRCFSYLERAIPIIFSYVRNVNTGICMLGSPGDEPRSYKNASLSFDVSPQQQAVDHARLKVESNRSRELIASSHLVGMR